MQNDKIVAQMEYGVAVFGLGLGLTLRFSVILHQNTEETWTMLCKFYTLNYPLFVFHRNHCLKNLILQYKKTKNSVNLLKNF